MTSKSTKEQRLNEVKELIANAEEWAGYYEHPIHDKPQREMFEGMARVMAEHLAALTAIDSEPAATLYHSNGRASVMMIGDLPLGEVDVYTAQRLAPEFAAIVERLNLSGYEYENGPVTARNTAAVVDILLQQLDDAVQGRNTQPAQERKPVKRVNADQMHRICLEATRHLDKYGAMAKEVNKLLGRIPAQPVPVVEPVSFDDLRDAVAEMSGGLPMEWDWPDLSKGHQAVPFINFNSLSRIVEKFRVNPQPAPVVMDEMLCKFYEVNSWHDLVRELVKHVEQLQDSARRNVKPWEDTFPETLLPAYIERIKQADEACRAAMLQAAPVRSSMPDGVVTAEHRRVIEMLLSVCGAAFELADDSCQQDVDGEECHVVPSDAFQKLSDALDEIENTLPTEDIDRPDVFLAWSAMPRAALKSLLQAGYSPVIPEGYVMVLKEPTEDMIVAGFESEPDEGFSEEDVWKAYQNMSGCQQAAHRARLCWAAMLAAVPPAPTQENI